MRTVQAVPFRNWIERCLLVAVFSGILAAALLVARNRLRPEQLPISFGLAFWVGFTLWHAALSTLLGVLTWLFTRRAGGLVREILLRGAAALLLATVLLRNTRALRNLMSLGEPARLRLLLPVAALAAVLGLLVILLVARRRWPARVLAALGVSATLAALWSQGPLKPAPPGSLGAPLLTGTPLVVVGLDGADWRLVEPLIARGELPHLAALRARGAWGPLETLKPGLSPLIWTTLATGAPPKQHGVTSFALDRQWPIADALPPLLPVRGLGYGALQRLLAATGLRQQTPVRSTDRRVPAYWNVATLARSPVAVVAWWATWPAEPVVGYVVSDRLFYTTWDWQTIAYPPSLFAELRPLVGTRAPSPEELRFIKEADRAAKEIVEPVPWRREIRRIFADCETTRDISLELLRRGRRDYGGTIDLLVLLKTLDATCHYALRYSALVSDHLDAPAEEVARYGGFVEAAYRHADRALGEILAAAGRANVVVVSDHGFGLETRGQLKRYSHTEDSPDGIFVAAGPAFAPGRIDGLSVHDVFPILLRARGLPITEEDNRRVDARVFNKEFLEAEPARTVERYGPWRVRIEAGASGETDKAMLNQLKELGYME